MEMIEAKQRQERLVAEQKAEKLKKKQERLKEKQLILQQRREERESLRRTREQAISVGSPGIEVEHEQNKNLMDADENDEEEFDYDDEISSSSTSSLPLGDPQLISGYASLSGACGTYAVREPEGLVVLPTDPSRPKYHITKNDEKKEGSDHSSALFNNILDDENSLVDTEGSSRSLRSLWKRKGSPSRSSSIRREPFSIAEGQKVQVVGVMESNDQGVYQLARGAGYVVATTKQLVKVGGPEETSCKMEGMLQSILEKQQEVQRKLDDLSNLAVGLKEKIILEQDKPEEVPVISVPVPRKVASISEDVELSPSATQESKEAVQIQHPTTPTRVGTTQHGSPLPSAGRESVSTVNSTVVELGMTPRTPSQTPRYYTGENHGEYVHSPAHSCPIPSNTAVNLDQPFLDDDAPSTTGSGVLRYRVNSDDDTSGMGWGSVLGCGTSLFGERLLESSEAGSANDIFNQAANGRSDILRLSQSALLQQANNQRRATALAAMAAGSSGYGGIGLIQSSGSADSPLRRGGSFDGGGGVNFRVGYSHHGGVSKTKRDFSCDQRIGGLRMSEMSQHRGAAPARLGPRSNLSRRSTAPPDTLVGSLSIR